MTYFILGLCLLAAVVTSWHLSAEPFFPESAEEETPVLAVSAQEIIRAELTMQAEYMPPAMPQEAPVPEHSRHI